MSEIIKDLKRIGVKRFAMVTKDVLLPIGNNPSTSAMNDYIKIDKGSMVGLVDHIFSPKEYSEDVFKRVFSGIRIYAQNGNTYFLAQIHYKNLEIIK